YDTIDALIAILKEEFKMPFHTIYLSEEERLSTIFVVDAPHFMGFEQPATNVMIFVQHDHANEARAENHSE
ncbi:hypothetical protein JYU14_02495, partial [Simkania negevensis]|nr:hypothetical protein [Simkania negevensis]